MSARELSAITVEVPIHHVDSFRELLKEHPNLQHVSQGWLFRKFAVMGAPADIAAFRARLPQWEHDCVSSDAW